VKLGIRIGSEIRYSPPSKSTVQPAASKALYGKRPGVCFEIFRHRPTAAKIAPVESLLPVGSAPGIPLTLIAEREISGKVLPKPYPNILINNSST
jgi:hypothetical protein